MVGISLSYRTLTIEVRINSLRKSNLQLEGGGRMYGLVWKLMGTISMIMPGLSRHSAVSGDICLHSSGEDQPGHESLVEIFK